MKKDYLQDLATIRNIMERQTKFISLSGLSGILSGSYALIGAYLANRLVYKSQSIAYDAVRDLEFNPLVWKLLGIATMVLVLSLSTGLYLSWRKAKLQGEKLWNPSAKRMLLSTFVPLLAGGIFVIIILLRHQIWLIAPACLVFYGLALYSGGNYTFSDVKNLGIVEIILGLICLWYPGKGLLFWSIGFGIMHIVYGVIMYLKYER